jgi:SAM-dependent methyltransferase
MIGLEEIAKYVSCPDDGGTLIPRPEGLHCKQCARSFPLQERNLLELLPLQPIPISNEKVPQSYREGYIQEFNRPFQFSKDVKAWGAPEKNKEKWVQVRQRAAREALQLVRDGRDPAGEVFCDISSGAGYCTFQAARKYHLVFHCDLSVDNLAYGSAKAKREGIENIIFVRADYFQLPFRRTIHQIVCLDTLIHGPWHEEQLLGSICRAMGTGGIAVVDFHNWWHNPIRRMGLLPGNFVDCQSYGRAEVQKLLKRAGIEGFEITPFVQEFDPAGQGGKILSRFIPATRFVVRLHEERLEPGPRK